MKLNNCIPGLPKWPRIDFNNITKEYAVSAKHISYRRYVLANWIAKICWLVALLLIGLCSYGIGKERDNGVLGVFIFLGLFVVAGLLSLIPWAKIMSRFVFPRKTRVSFSSKGIRIGFKRFDLTSGVVEVQFRAVPYLSDDKLDPLKDQNRRRKLLSGKAYLLHFYRIEMIYGLRVVPVTSVAKIERTEQFVAALQAASALSKQAIPATVKAERQPPPLPSVNVGDALPE